MRRKTTKSDIVKVMDEKMQDGDTVVVAINPQSASKRTRNRVKEGGPDFTFVKRGTDNTFRSDSVLLRSPKTGWFGWLPLGEIKIRKRDD